MNLKITLGLVGVAAIVGIVAYVNPFGSEEERAPRSPWFYQIAQDDIEFIGVAVEEESVRFDKTPEGTWAFDDPKGIPPSQFRWGGMTLLLSGPQTGRDLTGDAEVADISQSVVQANRLIDDPAEFGLDDPHTVVKVGLTGDRYIEFRLGDTTADGRHHYGEVVGFDELFLIASQWGDVVARLVTEPPFPKWFVDRTIEELEEFNVYRGNPESPDTPQLSYIQELDGWHVFNYPEDTEDRTVDPEGFAQLSPILTGHPPISMGVPLVEDQDYSPYGIVADSGAIEIRFSSVSDRGTKHVDGVLLRIGDKAPGTSAYYAKSESDFSREPVLLIDAAWVDAVMSLHEDIPYADEDSATASGG